MTVWEFIELCGVIMEQVIKDFKETCDIAFGGDNNEEDHE